MKTIQISDEMYEKLLEISKGLNEQDHRVTAMPYFFQIRTKKEVSCGEWFWEDGFYMCYWDDPESNIKWDNYKDILQFLKDNHEETYDEIKNKIGDILQANKSYKWCEDEFNCNEICDLLEENWFYKFYYKEEYQWQNSFFTEKACKEHIKANHYHYTEPVDCLSHANRNPEMELVLKFLCELSWWNIHK